MFELRKNKWLSHRQPGYNFWMSVQVFGCLYLEQGKWGQVSQLGHENLWLSHISIFGCLATCLVVPGAWTTKTLNAGCSTALGFL